MKEFNDFVDRLEMLSNVYINLYFCFSFFQWNYNFSETKFGAKELIQKLDSSLKKTLVLNIDAQRLLRTHFA